MNTRFGLSLATFAAFVLVGCGGGSDDDTETPADDNKFTQSGEWVLELPTTAGSSVCYDFDAKAEVADCAGTAWDIKIKSGGRTASLWTNSGVSGSGEGGAFGGPFDHDWAGLQAWKNGSTDPDGNVLPAAVFLADSASSVFTGTNSIQSAAFEYAVTGAATDHLLYPNFRVFLVTTDSTVASATGSVTSKVFALQVTGYYGTAGTPPASSGTTSGIVSFRWLDRAGGAPRSATVDARDGWVYYDLDAGAESSASGTWHIAFSRYNVKLNGGESGSGKVAGFVGKTPAGFYDAEGEPVAAKFTEADILDTTAGELVATDLAGPASANAWRKDSTTSPLSPAYTGTYPNALDYGWYTYYPSDTLAQAAGLAGAHMLGVNAERGALVRTGEGTGYARIQLGSIVYAAPAAGQPPYTGTQTWTIKYDLQPSASE